MTLNQLRTRWLEILEFFQQIESIIDVSLGTALTNFAGLVDTGAGFQKVSNLMKTQIYLYIQDAMSNGYLIKRMSEVYVSISTDYIMPPVRQLGVMLEAKDPAEIKKMKLSISREAKKANQIIADKIKKERKIFVQLVGKRMKEIGTTFAPMLTCLSPERKTEIKVFAQLGVQPLPKVEGNPWI